MTTARRTGATSLATLASCLLAFVVVHAMAPQWARSAGLDFWAMPDAQTMQRNEDERRKKLEAHADDLGQRVAAGDAVADSLIENRLGFQDAVDQIREINLGRDGFLIALQSQYYPVTDERELHACYLRAKIEHTLKSDPTRLAEVKARISGR